jgi:hypothetical protein
MGFAHEFRRQFTLKGLDPSTCQPVILLNLWGREPVDAVNL